MLSKRYGFFVVIGLFLLLGTGCENQTLNNLSNSQQTPIADTQNLVSDSTCNLPTFWSEVSHNFRDCQLKEVEKSQGYSQKFIIEGGNGAFEYCNTLVFRYYQTKAGDLYTYEKIQSEHYPDSEVGEYRISKEYYSQITNSPRCVSENSRVLNLSDDDLSANLFPSRNYILRTDLPDINVFSPDKFVQTVEPIDQQPDYAPNGTYTNAYGNEVPSPYAAPSQPAGASARCADGTYSFSQSRRGTCSHHGGVIEWY